MSDRTERFHDAIAAVWSENHRHAAEDAEASVARCVGNVGAYVYRQCRRKTRSRDESGRALCYQHRPTA